MEGRIERPRQVRYQAALRPDCQQLRPRSTRVPSLRQVLNRGKAAARGSCSVRSYRSGCVLPRHRHVPPGLRP